MNRVELHEEAELELFEAASYLNAERSALGDALIFVVAIAHDSRRPGYWRDRLR